jgi:signal transduction histidine kinase
MTWRWAGGLAGACAVGTVAAAASFHMPIGEALLLAGVAGGAALAAGAVGLGVLLSLRRRSLGAQVAALALGSVVTVGAAAMATAWAMFLSAHDLHSLLVILLATGTVSILVAATLGHRVAMAAKTLGEATRRIGTGQLGDTVPGTPPAEFAGLARELEAMSASLDEARQRERALEASRRELTAWVSHDLRTPLAGIRAIAEALDDGVADDSHTVTRYHRTLRMEVDRLTRLVDELFELSVIQAGALRLHIERASLGDLVSDALSATSASAGARGIRMEGVPADSGPDVDLSPSAMTRVLRNVLENAIRHTPDDGTVWVEAGEDESHAFVSVRDQCGGIPSSDLDRLFDLAFRGESARTSGEGAGAGLGLAIARGIVDAHHGDITVRNVDGGCQFTIRLPVRQPA